VLVRALERGPRNDVIGNHRSTPLGIPRRYTDSTSRVGEELEPRIQGACHLRGTPRRGRRRQIRQRGAAAWARIGHLGLVGSGGLRERGREGQGDGRLVADDLVIGPAAVAAWRVPSSIRTTS
jgi:hypothetical protein